MKCQTNCTNCNHLTKITHLVKMRRGKSGEEKETGGGKRERERQREGRGGTYHSVRGGHFPLVTEVCLCPHHSPAGGW